MYNNQTLLIRYVLNAFVINTDFTKVIKLIAEGTAHTTRNKLIISCCLLMFFDSQCKNEYQHMTVTYKTTIFTVA